jgi:hypothetical protein
MSVFRHNFPPDACPLGGIAEIIGSTPTAYSLTSGVALDPIRRVYLCVAAEGGFAYGTYDASGQMSPPLLQTISGTDLGGGSVVIDAERQIWLFAQQGVPGGAPAAILYGTYNANGEPIKVGGMSISGFAPGAAQCMTIDPINCLWWAGDDGIQSGDAQQVAYGTYDPETGATTQSGIFDTPAVAIGVTCAASDNLLWIKDFVTTYDPSTGAPGTWTDCGVYVGRFIGNVDERRKMIFIPGSVNESFRAFRYAPDGSLTLIGDTLMPSYARAVAVDPLATLLISPEYNGDLYCGKYC